MQLGGSIIAIVAWVASGFALLGAAWLISKWMGAVAPKPGGMAAWSNRADSNSRTEQCHIAHDERAGS